MSCFFRALIQIKYLVFSTFGFLPRFCLVFCFFPYPLIVVYKKNCLSFPHFFLFGFRLEIQPSVKKKTKQMHDCEKLKQKTWFSELCVVSSYVNGPYALSTPSPKAWDKIYLKIVSSQSINTQYIVLYTRR
jgi:hypothetical protein